MIEESWRRGSPEGDFRSKPSPLVVKTLSRWQKKAAHQTGVSSQAGRLDTRGRVWVLHFSLCQCAAPERSETVRELVFIERRTDLDAYLDPEHRPVIAA